MTVLRISAFAIGLSLVLPMTSFAFQTPDHLDQDESVQVASGARARVEPRVGWEAPKSAAAAEWQRFQRVRGAGWRALWDLDRGVPSRIFGKGIPIGGGDAVTAARAVISDHLALLAPGAMMEDFVQVSDHFDGRTGIRTMGFVQEYAGVRVLGGQLSVRIKNDRIFVIGSEAYPNVEAQIGAGADAESLREKASAWIAKDFGSRVEARTEIQGPFVLPIVRRDGSISYHGVVQVTVDARDPMGRWSVWLDGQNGSLVARKQTLMFASGTMLFNAPERWPGDVRLDQAARLVELDLGGNTVAADANGVFNFTGASIDGVVRARSAEVVVNNDAGANVTQQFTIADGQSFAWNVADDEFSDAQLNGFVATNHAKDRCKIIAPDMGWLFTDAAEVNMNLGDTCNAFSDGVTTNFFQASQQCENTGRLADVVFHEFGHSFHAHAVIEGVGSFDGALSEGGSDYLAATITGDNGMGRGFFYTDRALRDLDQAQGEATWPTDIGESHETGIIIGGALWDLRKLMIAAHGEQAGIERTDALFYATFQRAVDIPSTYVEVVAADDDDGDLSNGTPNICLINDAFSAHGLADATEVGPPLGRPQRTGFTVMLPVGMRDMACPGDTITDAILEWRLRSAPSTGGTLTLGAVTGGFATDIPAQEPGQVVEYRLAITTPVALINFPENRAAPWYEMFVGDVVNLYCTDFEGDPGPEGWSHELVAGEATEGADDWQWGIPAGTPGSNDPDAAFSGQRVYGNDLGGGNFNGLYQADKHNALHGPAVEVMGHTNVRLQYRRWLNVEDGNFDQGSISSNGTQVWTNVDSGQGGGTHHQDREWVFQDVDLSSTIVDGKVQIDFEITSDGGLEFGGWNVDDFCIVAFDESVVMPPRCGDGNTDPGETCDDGNVASGDGCEADCSLTPKAPTCGDGTLDLGEACDDGNATDGDGCQSNCTQTPMMMMPDPMMPDPMNPGLKENEGGCACTASRTHDSRAGSVLGLLLIAGLVLVRRRCHHRARCDRSGSSSLS